jgi:hypothetical protein
MNKTKWILYQRLESYKNDLKCIEKLKPIYRQHHQTRIRDNKLIIMELTAILTGKGLGVLHGSDEVI